MLCPACDLLDVTFPKFPYEPIYSHALRKRSHGCPAHSAGDKSHVLTCYSFHSHPLPSLTSPLHYFLCLSTFFLMCMCSVHVCMLACIYVVHMHVCSYVLGGLRLMLGVFLYHTLPYWGRGTDLFSPASQLSLRIPVFCWNHRQAASPPNIFIRSGNPRSGPQTCLASSSLWASPGPLFPFFSFPTL